MSNEYSAWDRAKRFAEHVTAVDPDIKLEDTGGGQSALIKRTNGGGWLVLTVMDSAPESYSAQGKYVYLCAYPPGEEWGSDGWQRIPVKSVRDALGIMQLAMPDKHHGKVFHIFWGEGYGELREGQRHEVRTFDHFTANNGFENDDRHAIANLGIAHSFTRMGAVEGQHVLVVRER